MYFIELILIIAFVLLVVYLIFYYINQFVSIDLKGDIKTLYFLILPIGILLILLGDLRIITTPFLEAKSFIEHTHSNIDDLYNYPKTRSYLSRVILKNGQQLFGSVFVTGAGSTGYSPLFDISDFIPFELDALNKFDLFGTIELEKDNKFFKKRYDVEIEYKGVNKYDDCYIIIYDIEL